MTEDIKPDGFPDMREVKRRRQRARQRKRIRFWACAAGFFLLLASAFLFSPVGPAGRSIFISAGSDDHVDAREEEPESGRDAAAEKARESQQPTFKHSEGSPPCIAIIIDDVGNGDAHLQEWLSIDAPLTFSVMPYYDPGPRQAELLHQAGFQVMLHVPTANAKPNSYSGKGQLDIGMSRDTVFATLDADLSQVPYAAGVNNHQGGAGCNDLTLMTYMCEWAKSRGLYVVDSNSSSRSQATTAAASLGMPRRKNQVFIDHDNDTEYIRKAMRNLADLAKRNGCAIGICHWFRPNTARVVGEMVQVLQSEGIHFAFVRDVSN